MVCVLSVVGDAPVDSEAPVVTSSISPEFADPVFKDAHRGRVCVRVFRGYVASEAPVGGRVCMLVFIGYVASEAPVVTSSISPEFASPVFEDAHRGRVCVRMFIGVSSVVLCNLKKIGLRFLDERSIKVENKYIEV